MRISLFLCLSYLFIGYSKAQNTCHPDYNALTHLYAATTNSTVDWFNDWPVSDCDVCDWYGVTCVNNRVTELRLANNNLRGYIPSEIGELTDLEYLDLSDNDLFWDIPPSIGNMLQLRSIRLSDNQLTGVVQSEIGNLSMLQSLHLDNNNLSGCYHSNLQNLKADFDSVFVAGNDLGDWAAFYLGDVNRCCFNSKEEFAVIALFESVVASGFDDDDGCMFTNEPCLQPGINCSGGVVTGIDFSDQGYSGFLPRQLKDLTFLRNFNIANNNFSNRFFVFSTYYTPLPKIGGNNLESLDLSGNSFYYDYNTFPHLGLYTFLNSMSDLKSLTYLNMSQNLMSGIDFDFINDNFTRLQTLDCHGNNTEFGNQFVGLNFSNLTSLFDLDLSDNLIEGPIPSEIEDMSQLVHLNLSNNQFSGEIPRGIGELNFLTTIDFNDNIISGEIPKSIGDLSNLSTLRLAHNDLVGFIPPELGSLSNLTIIRLDHNSLSGCYPIELTNLCSKITENDAISAGNQFADTWKNFCKDQSGSCCNDPEVYGLLSFYLQSNGDNWNDNTGWEEGAVGVNCDYCKWYGVGCNEDGKVISINLEDNGLDGRFYVSDQMSNITLLENLDLSENAFNGEIPTTIGQFSNLKRLDISGIPVSNFAGQLPDEIGNLTTLESLFIGRNVLGSVSARGPFPQTLGHLIHLDSLGITNMHYSGSFPLGVMSLTGLDYLNLSLNTLEGTIPEGWDEFIGLRYLSLAGNELSGELPITMGSLSTLEFLSLSFNSITGAIPLSFADLIACLLYTSPSPRD